MSPLKFPMIIINAEVKCWHVNLVATYVCIKALSLYTVHAIYNSQSSPITKVNHDNEAEMMIKGQTKTETYSISLSYNRRQNLKM
jgi:hypothetical protein